MVTLAMIGFLLALVSSAASESQDPATTLVAAERAFSKASVENGMRDAFLAYLADEGVLFRPLPVNGKKVWEPRARVPATLIWEPEYVEVSGAGDLGLTTGPWEFRPPPDAPDTSVGHGHFISVWRMQPDARWKVEVDIGTSHAPGLPALGSVELARGPAHAAKGTGDRSQAAARELRNLERAFARKVWSAGWSSALQTHAASDLRLHRDREPPRLGRETAKGAYAGSAPIFGSEVQGAGAARSGDFGYAYGVWALKRRDAVRADSSVFLHVWRREGSAWRLALAVDNPIRRR